MERIALVTFENEIAWGLRNIAEFLRSHGFAVSLYFLERYVTLPRGVPEISIDAFVKDFAPTPRDLVGISFMTPYLDYARALALRVKERGALVVAGGMHPTVMPDDCLSFSDYVIRGAGELAMFDLLQPLQNGMFPPKGVFRNKEEFWFNEDVTRFPHPRYGDKIDKVIVRGRVIETREVPRRLGLVTRYQTFASFGCPYGCTYCVNPILQDLSRRRGKKFLRRRNIDDIIAELIHVKDRIDAVSFEDEDFLVDTERVLALLDRYQAEIDLPFSCAVTPRTLKLEKLDYLVRRLKEAKCISVVMGLQSASPRTAKIFRRPFDREWLQQAAHTFAQHGIVVTYDVILANPFENDEDVSQTVETVLGLPHPCEIHVYHLTFFPGYVLTARAQEQGIAIPAGGDTITYLQGVPLETRVCRLAQIPWLPRRFLWDLYRHRRSHWSHWTATVLEHTVFPLWTNRLMSMLRLALMQPGLLFSLLRTKMRRRHIGIR